MSFYTDVLVKDPRFNTIHLVNDISLLEPGTRAKIAQMIVLAHQAGHELRVGETYRSQVRQEELFKRGLTQLKKVGCHGYGVACDLQLWVNGKYDPKGSDYAFFTEICQKVGLISGIDWGEPNEHHDFQDWDHVQNVPIHRQDDLFSGKWYPDINYNPLIDKG